MIVFLFFKSHMCWTVVRYTNVEVEPVRRYIITKIVSETLDLSLKSTSVDHEHSKPGIFVAGGAFCISLLHFFSS